MKRDKFLQRLFSAFPDGKPGLGLLLLRISVSVPLFYWGVGDLSAGADAVTLGRDGVAVAGGILLVAGLWTAVAGIVISIVEAWIACSHHFALQGHLLVAALAPLRPGVGDEHRRGAGQQPVGRRPRPAQAALDRPLQGVADDCRRQEGEAEEDDPAAVELAQLLGDHPPLADQQGRRGAGVQRHLEALAQLRVDRLPVPARQPGEEDDIGRAGDRQQLRRSLDEAQRDRAPGRQPTLAGPAQAPLLPAGSGVATGSPSSSPSPPPRRRWTSR